MLMENMLMPVVGFAVFVSTVLPRGFGERMQTRAQPRTRACGVSRAGVASLGSMQRRQVRIPQKKKENLIVIQM